MGLAVGIVGLPNVGKSTLFNALTKRQQAAAENYPFCTIEPNSAIVEVADQRLEKLAELAKPEQIIRATVEFTDIAGLVKGASKGEGLGNRFLANIRECDAILHVVRCFENDDIIHVQEGGNKSAPIDPVGDAEVIETELILADMEQLQKRYDKVKKEAQAKPPMRPEAEACAALLKHLEEGNPVRSFPRKEGDAILPVLRELHFLTDKKARPRRRLRRRHHAAHPLAARALRPGGPAAPLLGAARVHPRVPPRPAGEDRPGGPGLVDPRPRRAGRHQRLRAHPRLLPQLRRDPRRRQALRQPKARLHPPMGFWYTI